MNILESVEGILTSRGGDWHLGLSILVGTLGLLLLIVLFAWLWSRRLPTIDPKRRLLQGVAGRGSALASVGLVILGIRYQRALYLSSPLILLGWFSVMLWWLGDLGYRLFFVYPHERQVYLQAERRARWLQGR